MLAKFLSLKVKMGELELTIAPIRQSTEDEDDYEAEARDEVDGNFHQFRNNLRYSVRRLRTRFSRNTSTASTKYTAAKHPGFGLINLFTLKVLFIDVPIALGDVVTDFAQGVALVTKDDADYRQFGMIILAVNWLPGVVAAAHLISMYRSTMSFRKVALRALALLVFYPIVPFLAYMRLLWRRPKDMTDRAGKSKFREAEFQAMTAHAIAGGIESPIQFILQTLLILNGKIPKPWEDVGQVTIRDYYGNPLTLPTTAMISLAFSIASMLKSVVEFNIIRVHIQDLVSGERILLFIEKVCDHLPFLLSATVFRISAATIFVTYIHSYSAAPFALFWISNLAIGYYQFNLEKIPLWLISFTALFMPVCFTTSDVHTK